MADSDRVTFGGRTVDERTAAMLKESERLANLEDPTIGRYHLTQGCWSHAHASAGTHSGPGAFDQYTAQYTDKQKEIIGLAHRKVGFASWRRTRIPCKWEEHWHGIAIGTEGLPESAESQVRSYLDHRTGLRGNAKDDQERPDRILTWEQYQEQDQVSSQSEPDPAAAEVEETTVPAPAPADPYAISPGRQLGSEADSDGDGLTDSFERLATADAYAAGGAIGRGYWADPNVSDTNRDGLADGLAAYTQPSSALLTGAGSDPTRADADADGLSDFREAALGTNPQLGDTDADGLTDAFEARYRLDPLANGSVVAPGPRDGVDGGHADW
jgi:hypothetical protein